MGNRWISTNTEMFLLNESGAKELIETASSKYVFSGDDTNGYASPPGQNLELEHKSTSAEYWVTNVDTSALATFHDFTVTPTESRGRLKEFTSIEWRAAGKTGITYAYTYNAGVLASLTITTAGEQACSVTSAFANGRLASLSLSEGGTLQQKVEYFYFDDVTGASSQAGTAGDLVHVKVSKRAANDTGSTLSIVRHTLYRYSANSRLKGVYEHAAVARALVHFGQTDPQWLLKQADDHQTGGTGPKVEDFASRWFTYYTADVDTTDVTTAWTTGEDLEGTYGGANRDETHFVKSERVGACSTCGGSSSSGVTLEYYYMELDQGTDNDDNEVKYLVVEDSKDASGALYRKVFGLNEEGRQLREVFIDNPASSPKYWCRSWKFVLTSDHTTYPQKRHRVSEYRPPSAHNVTTSNVDEFLDPFDDGGGQWTNDTATLRAASDSAAGPTYVYVYNSDGRLTEEKLKRGHDETDVHYISATDYGDGSSVPVHLPVKHYAYTAKQTTKTPAIITEIAYDFWDQDMTQVRKITTTYPTISTSQNGSGTATTSELWYDKAGRLRWEKDGEGYITYYSYHKTTGQLGYVAVDVDPSSAPTGATDTMWVSWNDDGDSDGSYASTDKPSRDGALPTALALVTRQEFDIQGRSTLLTNPGGDRHYTLYETDRMIEFPYLDGSGIPQLPTRVTVVGDNGKVSEIYSVRADYTAISTSGGLPIGFSTEPDQDDYVSWGRYTYDGENGSLLHVERYHDIPAQASGTGTISTNFYRTAYKHDTEGRLTYTIEQVSGAPASSGNGVEQITQVVYDKLGRVKETKRGVSSAAHDMGADYSSFPSTVVTISKTFYDGADATTPLKVGDDQVTSTVQYHTVDGSGDPDEYTLTNYKLTYRGHIRGMEQLANGTTAILPVTVVDIDWAGRTTGSAQYSSAVTWSNVLTGDGYTDYLSANSTNRNEWTTAFYDDGGNVYRTETYPGTQTVNHFETNNYYDRNGRLVATGDKYAAHAEYAYDGAGRPYQSRTVTDVATTRYSSGKFQYRAPAPHPALGSMSTTGDDGLIEFSHTVYDAGGNVTEVHTFELNDTDSDGIDMDSTSSYVRRSAFYWYNAADRLTTMADYGAGDGTSGSTAWAYSTRPSRPSEPAWTDSMVYDGHVLLTTLAYHEESGRMDAVTTGVSKNGSDTSRVTTKTFFDDLGRALFVVENHLGSYDPTSSIGTVTAGENSTTGWVHNGLGQVTELTAYNSGSTTKQITKYEYTDDYDASLVEKTYYPDEVNQNGTLKMGAVGVSMDYNLDGSMKTRTDQREVVLTYVYDDGRRIKAEKVTSFGSSGVVDQAVQSITRKYDSLGRVTKVTSHTDASENPDATTNIANQIQYSYNAANLIYRIYQAHDGVVDTGTSPKAEFTYDLDHVSNVYSDGLRVSLVDYPVAAGAKLNTFYGNEGTLNDRLHRPAWQKLLGGTALNGNEDHTSKYEYNGTNRLVRIYSESSDTYLERKMYSSADNYDGFDRFGRPVRFEWKNRSSGNVLDRTDYTYDYAGNRLTRNVRVDLINGTYPDDRDQKYGHDGLQRLTNALGGTYNTGTGAIDSRNFEQDWTLDQLGNWPTFKERDTDTGGNWDLNQDRAHNEVNELTEFTTTSWVDPVHDAAGNMTTMPSPQSPTSSLSLTYDAWNRLVKVTQTGQFDVAAFEYDGLHRRIFRDVEDGNSFDRHYYYNDDWQLLTETTYDGTVEAVYHWHPFYVDALAVRMRADDTHFFLQDANYNVTAVVDDDGDAVVERYAYTPYGEVTVLDANFAADADGASDINNQHFYTGRERDPETGLQLNRRRYYAAHLGRWISRDPIGYRSATFNIYEYNKSNAVNVVDPSGLGNWFCVRANFGADRFMCANWGCDTKHGPVVFATIVNTGCIAFTLIDCDEFERAKRRPIRA